MNNTSTRASRVQAETAKSKNSQAIKSRFKYEKYSEATDDSIELTLRDYYLSAKAHSLSSHEMSEMFTSALKRSALDWLLNNFSTEMAYSDIADAMIEQYNQPHRKAALLSEVDGIRLYTFKQIHGD